MPTKSRLEISNDLNALAPAAARVEEFCDQHGIEPALTGKLNLCLEELLTNIIRHGRSDEASAPPILVDLELIRDGLEVVLLDSGKAFDPFTDAPEPDIDAGVDDRPIGGLGVHLVKALADRYEYRREGAQNRVTLAFSLG